MLFDKTTLVSKNKTDYRCWQCPIAIGDELCLYEFIASKLKNILVQHEWNRPINEDFAFVFSCLAFLFEVIKILLVSLNRDEIIHFLNLL